MNAKKISITSLILAGALLAAPAAFAGEIGQRQAHQQARIAQGIASGQLTAREATRLERQEGALQSEKVAMRTLNGGTLTRTDKVILNNQENRISDKIYREKHNRWTR